MAIIITVHECRAYFMCLWKWHGQLKRVAGMWIILRRQRWMTFLWRVSCCIHYSYLPRRYSWIKRVSPSRMQDVRCVVFQSSAQSSLSSTAFPEFARILETCFISVTRRRARPWQDWRFLAETENYTKAYIFFTGFELAMSFLACILWVPGLNHDWNTGYIGWGFLMVFTQFQLKVLGLCFKSGHGRCVPHCFKLFTVIQSSDGACDAAVGEALRYKPEGRGFDSRWCHWYFSFA
jgi:hypothetical protein